MGRDTAHHHLALWATHPTRSAGHAKPRIYHHKRSYKQIKWNRSLNFAAMQPEYSPTDLLTQKKYSSASVADNMNCQKQSAKTKDTTCQSIGVDCLYFLHIIYMNNKKNIILSNSVYTILTSMLEVYCR